MENLLPGPYSQRFMLKVPKISGPETRVKTTDQSRHNYLQTSFTTENIPFLSYSLTCVLTFCCYYKKCLDSDPDRVKKGTGSGFLKTDPFQRKRGACSKYTFLCLN